MNREDKNEFKDALVKKVKEIGEGFVRSPESLVEYLSFAARFHQYSHKNLMIIYAQRPDAQFVASASAWYAGLPGADGKPLSESPIYIKKDERAMYVWSPVTVNYYSKDGEAWSNIYQLTDEEKKELKERPEQWQVKKELRFKLGPVFDIGQVKCPKELLPEIFGIGVADISASLRYVAMRDYCTKELNIPVNEKDFGSLTIRGRYLPLIHTIEINNLYEDEQKLSTLLHELGHSQLHSVSQTVIGKTMHQKELEADMYSLMLEKQLGIGTTDARKAHLSAHYNNFLAEQSKRPEGERVTVDKVFDAVFARYQKTLPDIKSALERTAAPMQQVPDIGYKSHTTLSIGKI